MDGTHRQVQFRGRRKSDAYTWDTNANAWDTHTHAYAGDTYTYSYTYTDAKIYSIAKASTHAASSADAPGVSNCDRRSVYSCSRLADPGPRTGIRWHSPRRVGDGTFAVADTPCRSPDAFAASSRDGSYDNRTSWYQNYTVGLSSEPFRLLIT